MTAFVPLEVCTFSRNARFLDLTNGDVDLTKNDAFNVLLNVHFSEMRRNVVLDDERILKEKDGLFYHFEYFVSYIIMDWKK